MAGLSHRDAISACTTPATQSRKKKASPGLGHGLVAGLAWGLVVACVDGLGLLLQGTPWPHLGERLLGLSYLASLYGLLGALLGVLLAALWSVLARLIPALKQGQAAGGRRMVIFVLAVLIAGTLAAALALRFEPKLAGWVLIALLLASGLALGCLATRGYTKPVHLPGPETRPRLKRHLLSAAIALLFLLALVACASSAICRSARPHAIAREPALGQSEPDRPNILLVTASGLRAGHLGAYGYDPAVSPNLDALAARGVLFEQAVAPGSWGRPSTAALLTSLYPAALGYFRDAESLYAPAPDPQRTTLAESLRDAGYQTGAVLASPWLGAPGFAQGFAAFEAARPEEPFDPSPMRRRLLGRAIGCENDSAACRLYLGLRSLVLGTGLLVDQGDETVNARSIQFLDGLRDKPFFLWINYDDALPPYNMEEPFQPVPQDSSASSIDLLKSLGYWQLGDPFTARETLLPLDHAGLASLYNGEVRRVDRLLGEILSTLETRGLAEHTVVVVTSDHGQEFADHGAYTFGHSLYEEVVRVPLVIAGPAVTGAGNAIATPVSLVDVAPTLAELAGATLSGEAQGVSLVPSLVGQAVVEHPVYSQALYRVPFDAQAIRTGSSKLIYSESDGHVELYDLIADPGENHDLAAEMPELASRLRDQLLQWKSEMRDLALAVLTRTPVDDGTAGRLW